MVPLVVLNGWPAMGCICADGKFSTNCAKLRAPDAAEAKNASCSCGSTCCSTWEQPAKSSCCHASEDVAKETSKTSQQESRPTINAGDCCQIVWQLGDTFVVQEVQSNHEQAVSLFETAAIVNVVVLLNSNATCIENDTGQRASDLVVTLRRLLI
jgi:hypothetical protein